VGQSIDRREHGSPDGVDEVEKEGGAHVHRHRVHLRHLLAAVPPLLHLRLPQQPGGLHEVRAAHVSRLLLAGHVQCDGQPAHLLLDE